MNTRLIAALLVAVSATVAAPAFSSESTVTRAQVRAELAQLQQAGYPLNRATDATYPNDLQAALTQIHVVDAVARNEQASGYGSNGEAATQSGRRHALSVADRSVYFGH
ncbi:MULTISPECIES: DUF4148 domain-containing protein [Burkholderia]|uniref:DUF4148 domain-containing protein n=1 Tax=Burkholderia contaminans TaxID=488447 RepID=A0A2S5E066_9BURK|nr:MULTISPECIES: DUF4148 domain-containing protein [Burkholderia]EKS9798077.1 DUF4148 domain-containing protein [Burkholderia cepacia]EKS9805138.1 DUF4148 domain-containing protein [Burkholderia cepacia]EKS9812183.1 DUF4148 domain-containing protein [Burkholderia cepacia]EKS9822212.1 DUF4148 domain-containing protein [Burkholderia cepacia]EKS9829195.1 DUF4148 domain-containing protein [Burkholderia cepacia]